MTSLPMAPAAMARRPAAVATKAPGPRQQPNREIIKYSKQEIQQIRRANRKGTIINQILCSLAETT